MELTDTKDADPGNIGPPYGALKPRDPEWIDGLPSQDDCWELIEQLRRTDPIKERELATKLLTHLQGVQEFCQQMDTGNQGEEQTLKLLGTFLNIAAYGQLLTFTCLLDVLYKRGDIDVHLRDLGNVALEKAYQRICHEPRVGFLAQIIDLLSPNESALLHAPLDENGNPALWVREVAQQLLASNPSMDNLLVLLCSPLRRAFDDSGRDFTDLPACGWVDLKNRWLQMVRQHHLQRVIDAFPGDDEAISEEAAALLPTLPIA